MRKDILLKKVIENPQMREKYWPNLEVDSNIHDYKPLIIREKNKYLNVLSEIISEDSKTARILYKKIFNLFEI